MAIKPPVPKPPATPPKPTTSQLADTWEAQIDKWLEGQPAQADGVPFKVPTQPLAEAVRVELAERYAVAGWHAEWAGDALFVLTPKPPTSKAATSGAGA